MFSLFAAHEPKQQIPRFSHLKSLNINLNLDWLHLKWNYEHWANPKWWYPPSVFASSYFVSILSADNINQIQIQTSHTNNYHAPKAYFNRETASLQVLWTDTGDLSLSNSQTTREKSICMSKCAIILTYSNGRRLFSSYKHTMWVFKSTKAA